MNMQNIFGFTSLESDTLKPPLTFNLSQDLQSLTLTKNHSPTILYHTARNLVHMLPHILRQSKNLVWGTSCLKTF